MSKESDITTSSKNFYCKTAPFILLYSLRHCLLMQDSLSGHTLSLRQPTSHSRSSQICLGPHLESLLQTVRQSPPRHRSSARQFWSLKQKCPIFYLEQKLCYGHFMHLTIILKLYHEVNTLLLTLFLGFLLSGSGLCCLHFGETCCLHLQSWKLKPDNVVLQTGLPHLNCIYYPADVKWSQTRECPSKFLLGKSIHMHDIVQSITYDLQVVWQIPT